MKTNELRIGNYLQGKNSHVIIQTIYPVGHVKIKGNRSVFMVEGEHPCLSPILLTEEWLLRFGFKPKGEGYSIGIYEICDFKDFSDGSTEYILYQWDSYNEIESAVKANIRYVHQLQNLYFVLTDEELTLN